MLERLNQFIIRCSFSAWKFILLFAGFIGSLQVLNMISDKFKLQAGGHEPFDLQNGLTAGQIYEQLSTYTEQAFLLYYSFTAVDYLFPLFAGFFLAAIWAFVLRHTNSRWYEVALQNNLFVLLLVPTFFDYAENIAILAHCYCGRNKRSHLPMRWL